MTKNPFTQAKEVYPSRWGLGTVLLVLFLAGFSQPFVSFPLLKQLPRHRGPKKQTIGAALKYAWRSQPSWRIGAEFEYVSPAAMTAAQAAYWRVDFKYGFKCEPQAIYTRADLDDFLGMVETSIPWRPSEMTRPSWNITWNEDIDFERETLVILRHVHPISGVKITVGAPSLVARRLTVQLQTEVLGDFTVDAIRTHCLVVAVDRSKVDEVVLRMSERNLTTLALDEHGGVPNPPTVVTPSLNQAVSVE